MVYWQACFAGIGLRRLAALFQNTDFRSGKLMTAGSGSREFRRSIPGSGPTPNRPVTSIVPPEQAFLLTVTNTADRPTLHARYAPGLNYLVQNSTSMVDWTNLRVVSATETGGYNRLLPTPGNPQQFFRAAILQSPQQ